MAPLFTSLVPVISGDERADRSDENACSELALLRRRVLVPVGQHATRDQLVPPRLARPGTVTFAEVQQCMGVNRCGSFLSQQLFRQGGLDYERDIGEFRLHGPFDPICVWNRAPKF
jgi:uncharacterized protein YcaQ